MKTISQLKSMALDQLKGNWYKVVVAALVYLAVTALTGTAGIFSFHIITFLIVGPLTYGFAEYFMKIKRKEPAALENLFDGFKRFIPSFLVCLLVGLFTILWALLLIVPGIIASISYSQSYYILVDDPNISAMDAIKKSKEMMQGYKGQYFWLALSFIGWAILATLTGGIGYLWLVPYYKTTMVNFYDELKVIKAIA